MFSTALSYLPHQHTDIMKQNTQVPLYLGTIYGLITVSDIKKVDTPRFIHIKLTYIGKK
jgi:hypothetical protein